MDLLGVNLAGAEFGSVGQAYGTGYTYPTHAEIDYYAASGMNVIRLPFLWERLQPTLGGALDKAELARLDDVVSYATSKGLKVDLDVHNYGKYNGQLIGSAAVPDSAFANLWSQIAGHYATNPNVIFGLMNEPQESSATGWLASVNTAIAAIRATGAAQEVLVPGINWDGAWTWANTPNATVIGTGVVDPAKNYAFEVHQYLDSDGSGTSSSVASAQTGVDRLQAATQWAEQTGNRLFLGEFGVANDATSLAALKNMLAYMNQHTAAWQGATYWAGGPWWGSYMYSIEPTGLGTGQVTDQAQMTILKQFETSGTTSATSTSTTVAVASAATDPGPTFTAAASIGTLEAAQSEVIGTVAPGMVGQAVTLTQTGGSGVVALGATLADGSIQIVFTAPAMVAGSVQDALTYSLTDAPGGVALQAATTVQLDAGPSLAATVPAAVGLGKSVVIGTVTPGLAGDRLTLIVTGTTPAGTLSLNGGQVVYTAPASAAHTMDSFTYQVIDQYGGAKAIGSGTVALDPGPMAGAPAITVGHGQTVDLTAALLAAATPGIAGDTLSLTGATASRGTAAVAAGHATYVAPSSGTDRLVYTVADQLGDAAQGTATITVDPGPTAGNVTSNVKLGASVDLSATILAAAVAGLKGDQLTIQASNTTGTLGTLARVNGDLVYTATGAGLASLAAGQTVADKFGFTIADQYGDTASATATVSVNNPAAVVNPAAAASPVPAATPAAVASTPVVPVAATTTPLAAATPTPVVSLTLQGYANLLTLGNGNYAIAAGLGSARITLGDGADTVTLAGYSNTIVAGNGNDTVKGGGGSSTITLGNGDDTVNTPGYFNQITIGAGHTTIVAGSGSDTVVAGAGTDQITLGGYGNSVTLNGTNATVAGGQGSNTIVANGGTANLTLGGWSNHITLNGAITAAMNDQGQGLKLDIGSATQTDTVTGFGSDGLGIVDFKGATSGFSSVSDILKALHSDGNGGTTLIFGGTGSIDFLGTPQGMLHASNFQIG